MSILFSLIMLGFLWGSSFVLARYAMTHGLSPLLYTFFHIIGPIVLLVAINLRKIEFLELLKKHGKFFFVAATIGMLIPDLNKFFLAQHLPSGSLGVITNTVPLFIYPLALIMREESFTWLRFFGVILGVIGIFFLVTGSNFLTMAFNVWALLALLTPLCYAVASVYIVRNNPRDCSPPALCFGMLFYAALLLLPFAFIALPRQISSAITWDVSLVVVLEILLTTLGYILLFVVLRKAGSVCYSLTDGIVAITSLFWGALFFAEKVTAVTGVGIFLILLGIVIVVRKQLAMVIADNKRATPH